MSHSCACLRLRLCVFVLLISTLLITSAAAELPSAVASRVKKIDSELKAVEQALEKNQLPTAKRRLAEANKVLKEINDRYKGKFEETDPQYKAAIDKLAAVTASFDSADAGANKAKEEAQAGEKQKEEQSRLWIERFKPFLDSKSDKDLPTGSSLNYLPEDKQAVARESAKEAHKLFAEYKNTEFPNGKSFELTNIESSIADRLKYYADLEQTDVKEESCAPWVDLLAPYAEVGRGSPKLLIPSATMDSEAIKERTRLFEEAKADFAAFKKADFPHGKTHRLEQIEKLMEEKLAAMPKALEESRAMISGDIEQRLDQVINQFESNSGWKNDESAKPPTIMARDLKPLEEAVEQFAAGNADKASALREKVAKIKEMDKANRVVWGQRTFQQKDAYSGSDLEQLKAEARQAALKTHPNAEIFHVTVTSKDWAVEDVVEFTDTTRSALRRRITRSLRGHVSLKTAAGETWLQGIYLGQDKQSDGTWGKLQGHTTWTDPMAEANIGKMK